MAMVAVASTGRSWLAQLVPALLRPVRLQNPSIAGAMVRDVGRVGGLAVMASLASLKRLALCTQVERRAILLVRDFEMLPCRSAESPPTDLE